jgi:hypothetical protein
MRRSAVVVAGAVAACGGGGKPAVRSTPVPVPTVRVGDCGRPGIDGVIGERPDLVHADRDLNGDGVDEVVVADRTMCTPEGNCYWNVFVPPPDNAAEPCQRFAGTLAAIALTSTAGRGEDNYVDLLGFWRLTGGGRLLRQEYKFRRGGYQVIDAVLCRQEGDQRLLCEEPSEDDEAPW